LFSNEIIKYISKKVLKDAVLDVFYLISQAGDIGISKIQILHSYQEQLGIEPSTTKYRATVDVALATLLGTTFVDYRGDGTSHKYYLTQQGLAAIDIVWELIQEDRDIVRSTKILVKVTKGEMVHE
jgi:hypothetical protein